MKNPTMSLDELKRFLADEFPQALGMGMRLTRCDGDGVEVTLETRERHLRPGNTVSGPTLMTLADCATYLVILSRLGPVALAVTSSLEIHFLRKPLPGQISAAARLARLGRRSAVAQVDLFSNEVPEPIAIATVTYAIPPSRA